MKASAGIRQLHRWVSVVFTVAVVINIASFSQEEPPMWVGLLALAPLALLQLTGMYLFALPYVVRGQAQRGADEET